MLSEVAALVIVHLQVKQVEGLLAGAQDQRDGVAVPQGELQLHIDFLGRQARYPVGAEPVVLAVLHHVADLEGPDGSVVLIHPTDLLPLEKIERGRGGRDKQREMKRAMPTGLRGNFLERNEKDAKEGMVGKIDRIMRKYERKKVMKKIRQKDVKIRAKG